MKTYTEDNKLEPFDWNTFLRNAARRKTPLPDYQVVDAQRKSQSWVTCACGVQCSVLPRDKDGQPSDRVLNELGLTFDKHIRNRRWKMAQKTLAKIERRSQGLIVRLRKDAIKLLEDLGHKVI